MKRLTATADQGKTGHYVARITGRDGTKFARRIIGDVDHDLGTKTAHVIEPGLYEICDARKGGKKSSFIMVVTGPEGLHSFSVEKPGALKIARALDLRPFDVAVEYTPPSPELERLENALWAAKQPPAAEQDADAVAALESDLGLLKAAGLDKDSWRIRPAKEAARLTKDLAFAAAVAKCQAVLCDLAPREAARALAAVKKTLAKDPVQQDSKREE